MKQKFLRTLVAIALVFALVLPAACGEKTPPSIAFAETEISLKVGETDTKDVAITVSGYDLEEEIVFESSKTTVATVALKEDKTGVTVTAVGRGTTRITAKKDGETEELAKIDVTVAKDVEINAPATAKFDLQAGSGTITYTVDDSNSTVTAVSKDTSIVEVASVNEVANTVNLTAKALGTADVEITATNSSGSDKATVSVTIQDMYLSAPTDIFTFEDNADESGWIISITDVDSYVEDTVEEENPILVIPASYNDKPVTEIAENFLKTDVNVTLTELYIPETVKVIGAHAFEGCAALKAVHFKSGSELETIGDSAFEDCKALATFDGLTKADFSGCTKLKTIGKRAFYQHHFEALYIPKSVTTIDTIAFAQNYFPAYAGENASVLETVVFEEDTEEGWEERAVSLLYGPKLADDPTGIFYPYEQGNQILGDDGTLLGYDGSFDPANGAFANNKALSTVYLRNIKFCASLTFYNCALTEIYIDEKCAKEAFVYDASKLADGQWITGNAFYYAYPENNKPFNPLVPITPEEHQTVLVIDNETMMTNIGDVPNGFVAYLADNLGILGYVDAWAGTYLTRIWHVYVKEGIEPSQSFKDGYEKQDESDREGYTYWVWKQA